MIMLFNYLKTALRNLFKYKGYSFVNIAGLTLGFTAAVYILLYVDVESSYDEFHRNKDRIYRVTVHYVNNEGVEEHHAGISNAVGPILKEEIPEVRDQVRVIRTVFTRSSIITYPNAESGPVHFHENGIYFVDTGFLKVFDYKLKQGNRETALADPNGIVITESMANKYFGSKNPMGEPLVFNDEFQYTVTGVLEDVPLNSHQQFDFLIPIQSMFDSGKLHYPNLHLYGSDYHTYVLLDKDADISGLETRFLDVISNRTDRMFETTGLELQPMTDIHLHSNLTGELHLNGSALIVYSLGVIAIIILGMAWLNYLNLSVIKNSMRLKEIGVRKSLGAFRNQVKMQLVTESVLVNAGSLVLALILFEITRPWFNDVIGYELPALNSTTASHFSWIILLFVIGSILSGLVSGWLFSNVKPADVLRGRIIPVLTGRSFRKVVVTLQFACVFMLIAGAYTVKKQMRYMQDKDLGMNLEKIMVLKGPGMPSGDNLSRGEAYDLYKSKFKTFKSLLLRETSISGVASSNYVPGDDINFKAALKRPATSNQKSTLIKRIFASPDFAPVYGLDVVAGRFFSEDKQTDSALVLNESAVKLLGYTDPEQIIGEQLLYWDNKAEVIGVVKDFNFSGLKQEVEPVFFHKLSDRTYYSVKIRAEDIDAVITKIKNYWTEIFGYSPFEFFFTQDHFYQQYQAEKKFGVLMNLFSILAISVACLGLFGLISLSFLKRVKEIGIRKVLGASNLQVLALLSRKYLYLILVSVLVAVPVSYLVITKWLGDFAYRIDIGWDLFLLPFIIILLVTGLTVGMLMGQTVSLNPAESLRVE